ncbi:MAG: exodeoxyribonuclease III [Alphaproteobacteria bacterium]|nr:exodeoxyribonuclease III [Alphaproteobacteria bacterium]
MRLATWNVNSIKARLPNVVDYLREASPDVVLLQELKAPEQDFPHLEIGDLGYNAAVLGQKTYNGVAILSKFPIADIRRDLPGDDEDEHARYIEGETAGIRVASLYLPNGNPIESPKFDYKLAWMKRLAIHARELLESEEPFVLGGDFNVTPTDVDVFNPVANARDAVCRPEARAGWRELVYLGLTDAFRALHPDETRAFSYWDYRAGSFRKGDGMRIDHFLLSPALADRLTACDIDKKPRAQEKASDHTPVWIELADAPPQLPY